MLSTTFPILKNASTPTSVIRPAKANLRLFFISPFAVDKGGIDIHLHILPYKEIQRRTGQQKEHKPGFSAGIHQNTSYKEYYLPIFNGCQIKNNQKNRQEPKQEFQTAENKAILTNYVS